MASMCGMYTCKKCSVANIVFGILLLIVALGLWGSAPAWWNGWTIIGVYLLLWGLGTVSGKPH